MQPMENNVFVRLLNNHALPFIPALDPFRLQYAQIKERLDLIETLGGEVAFLASTDDERYDEIVPELVARLNACTKTTIFEHFRPIKGVGFRRSSSQGGVLMTKVLTSRESFFRDCGTVQMIGDVSGRSLCERVELKLISSGAILFGPDAKSERYVLADPLLHGSAPDFDQEIIARSGEVDVVYLFSRGERLAYRTVEKARAALPANVAIIASGCVRTPDDVRELRSAGATQIVVGSLLERPNWRDDVLKLSEA
jgi:heptaprenylglyceryl phosphate synthase